MTPQTFLSNFGHIANAPDGLKSLRQLVMASALAGKFSAPNDDLPSDIDRLLEETRSLHFHSVGKREKPLLFASPLIREFEIPVGWKWVRVGQICDLQTGATPSTQRPEYWGGEIPWLASGDVHVREIFQSEGRITEEGLANSNCKILPKNSVLIALNGQGKTRATVALLRIPAACNQSLVAMIPFDIKIVAPEYIFLSLRYRYYEIRDVTGQDQRRGLNMGLVSDLSVPLAPVAEQKRIVAKVDELMALCDKLEAQQQERERRFPVLSRTCHARFTEAPTHANLNRIFDEADSVSPADLRRSIVNIALQGRLVRQFQADEPVDHLLARCMVEREMNGRASTGERDVDSSVHTRIIPETWKWMRLDDLLVAGPTNGISPKSVEHVTTTRSLTLSATTSGRFNGEHSKFIETEVPLDSDLWLRPGDILVQRGNSMEYVGVAAVYFGGEHQFVYPDLMMRCRFASELDVRFIHLAMNQDDSRDFLRARATGTSGSMPKINQTTLKSLPIPVPPIAEQRRIVAKVNELMALVDQLEVQQQERDTLAEAFAKACVASFTGTTQPERPEKMKAPKTELISLVTLGERPKPDAKAPLAQLLIQAKGTLPAKSLWQQSGYSTDIDAFYQQLKTEIAQGWIAPPAEAEMKVLEEV
jgi:type I restriction enzyme, S subunit